MLDTDLLHLLKHGRTDELRSQLRERENVNYATSFPAFMDEMLQTYHIKRNTIAIRSGLSRDYTYKLLRGDKKTNERDYILAICLAIGMNLAQIQHALQIYGMPILDKRDLRSHVIILGIEDGGSIDKINGFLEKAGFPYLRTSPDMPAAPITPVFEPNNRKNPEQSLYTKIRQKISAVPCGTSPLDFSCNGYLHLQDEARNDFTVLANFSSEEDHLYAIHGKPERISNNQLEESDLIESYSSVAEAADSPFFQYYLELDKATDEKALETLSRLDDTKNYGVRIGAHIFKSQWEGYLEAFNDKAPERCEYYQIIRSESGYAYSITHKSIFLQIEMGDVYPALFSRSQETPLYLLNVSNLSEAEKADASYRYIFSILRNQLNQQLKAQFGPIFSDESYNDQVELDTLEADIALVNGDPTKALRFLASLFELCSSKDDIGSQKTALISAWKIATCYNASENMADQKRWLDVALSYEDTAQKWYEILDSRPDAIDVADILGRCFYEVGHIYNVNGNPDAAKQMYQASIRWFERCDLSQETAYFYADTLTAYAFMIDNDAPEQSLEYLYKALELIQRYQLITSRERVLWAKIVLNNYAWVLWNRFAREEAIIYYGRAIDLVRWAMKDENDTEMLRALQHVAKALYKIYQATGKIHEGDRLISAMSDYGLDIIR